MRPLVPIEKRSLHWFCLSFFRHISTKNDVGESISVKINKTYPSVLLIFTCNRHWWYVFRLFSKTAYSSCIDATKPAPSTAWQCHIRKTIPI